MSGTQMPSVGHGDSTDTVEITKNRGYRFHKESSADHNAYIFQINGSLHIMMMKQFIKTE